MRALFNRACRHHRLAALGLALAALVAARTYGARVASGADSYGYVSQAELWVTGHLRTAQPFSREMPWHEVVRAFAPLGYVPTTDDAAIVPAYAPGLPLLMAAAIRILGQCGAYWVVPLSLFVLVLTTYLLGVRIGRPLVGVAAAALAATSPAVTYSSMVPMSDVPAAAAWTLVLCCVLAESPAWALILMLSGGLAASVGILIRPNLVPIAGMCLLWIAWRDVAARRLLTRQAGLWWFAAGAVPGPIFIAWINRSLYGSPFASGYGDLSASFASSHVPGNLVRYATWLGDSHTLLVFAGLAALVIPARFLWPTVRERRALPLFVAVIAFVWMAYAFFAEFDAWWYLRYLLPAFPPLFIGLAVCLSALWRVKRPWTAFATIALILGLGGHGVIYAMHRGALGFRDGEQRYVDIARGVTAITEPNAVIICMQHSGSTRYYGGRLTMRYDYIDGIDLVVDWLSARGVHAYVLLDRFELEPFRTRFAGTSVLGRLQSPALMSYRSGETQLFDALPRTEAAKTINVPPSASVEAHCSRAAPPPVQVLRGSWR